ncbi:MAG: hypothetical protein J5614_04890 [Paludibacteraceae bacterium]|nr:hypothetical protein [Paludibacteraceae bacterium]
MSIQNSSEFPNVKVMLKTGVDGVGIESIEKTGTVLNVDTYTITLTNGVKETFNVTNGTSIASIAKTGTQGLIDTYTITLTDGTTTTFTVTNGASNLSIIAPIQTSLVASQNYDIGEQFIYNDNLYTATAVINEGGTISINVNCTLAEKITEQIDNNIYYEDVTTSTNAEGYADVRNSAPIDKTISVMIVGQNYRICAELFINSANATGYYAYVHDRGEVGTKVANASVTLRLWKRR